MSRYNHSPADKDFLEWEQKKKEQRFDYWAAIRRMREEYMKENQGVYDLTARPTVHYWAEQKYGFKMGMDEQCDYTGEYTVVDPKKFMLFQLKFWS
jgi:hypothetical protein